MRRELDMEQVSDGKRYTANDMVRADCRGCVGCSRCCHEVGDSILLDPYDVYSLEQGLSVRFEGLLEEAAALRAADGVILPYLRVDPETGCAFLASDGRCTVHDFRPGFCRLFPLGRIYEDGGFSYFLQVRECPVKDKPKVKVRKWLGIPELERYERFVLQWHDLLARIREFVRRDPASSEAREICTLLLKLFYLLPYEKDRDFYVQFERRLAAPQWRVTF